MQRDRAVLLTGLGLAILVGCLVLSALLWGGVREIQADVLAQRSELAATVRRLGDAVASIESLRSSLDVEVAARSSSIAGLEGKLSADTAALSEVRADHDALRSEMAAIRAMNDPGLVGDRTP